MNITHSAHSGGQHTSAQSPTTTPRPTPERPSGSERQTGSEQPSRPAVRTEVRAVVFDFGRVLSREHHAPTFAQIADTLAVDPERLRPAYFKYRLDYDRGTLCAADYWSAVQQDLAIAATRDPELIARLVRLDVTSWDDLNPETLQLLLDLQRVGHKTAILSNMPIDGAKHYRSRYEWIEKCTAVVFSAEHGVAKPDAGIYHLVCRLLQEAPGDVLFIDDSPANIAGATAVGLQTHLFAEPTEAEASAVRARYGFTNL